MAETKEDDSLLVGSGSSDMVDSARLEPHKGGTEDLWLRGRVSSQEASLLYSTRELNFRNKKNQDGNFLNDMDASHIK